MRALILAAGRGERMRPLTLDTAKPLLKAGGRALIDYHVAALAAAGITDLVVNLSWQAGQLRDHLGDGSRFGVRITYSDEGPEPLETGGGIRQALDLLGPGPFWVVNGDIWCDYRFHTASLPPGVLAHLVLVPNPPHHAAGDFVLAGDRVVPGRGPRLTFAGVSILSPALLSDHAPGRFPLAPLLRSAVEEGRVTGELHTGRWTDVGTPERLAELDAALTSPV